jgi:hypothetical protein
VDGLLSIPDANLKRQPAPQKCARHPRKFYRGYSETPAERTIVNKIDILKKAVRFVVAAGVSQIVNGIIENNTETDTLAKKVSVKTASIAIGGAVATAAGDYTDKQIDDIVTAIQSFKKKSEPIVIEV